MEKIDKNEKEKKLLNEYALLNSLDYNFPVIDKNTESYFHKRHIEYDGNAYLKEYFFENLPELIEELDTLWGMDDNLTQIKKVVGVAAMKNVIVDKETEMDDKAEKSEESENGNKLPMHIYNF